MKYFAKRLRSMFVPCYKRLLIFYHILYLTHHMLHAVWLAQGKKTKHFTKERLGNSKCSSLYTSWQYEIFYSFPVLEQGETRQS